MRRRQWQPTPVLLPGKSHGQRSLEGCSPWGRWGSDMTERLHFYFSLSCIGEGNGNPFQCSCLGNPRDGRAWWTAIYGVTQSWAWLKWLSSSSSSSSSSSDSKASTCNARDLGSVPGWGRSLGEWNGNPLQYSCLENPVDRGAWWLTVHGVAKSRSDKTHAHRSHEYFLFSFLWWGNYYITLFGNSSVASFKCV